MTWFDLVNKGVLNRTNTNAMVLIDEVMLDGQTRTVKQILNRMFEVKDEKMRKGSERAIQADFAQVQSLYQQEEN